MKPKLKNALTIVFGAAAVFTADLAYLSQRDKQLKEAIKKDGYTPVIVTVNLLKEDAFVAQDKEGAYILGENDVAIGTPKPAYQHVLPSQIFIPKKAP